MEFPILHRISSTSSFLFPFLLHFIHFRYCVVSVPSLLIPIRKLTKTLSHIAFTLSLLNRFFNYFPHIPYFNQPFTFNLHLFIHNAFRFRHPCWSRHLRQAYRCRSRPVSADLPLKDSSLTNFRRTIARNNRLSSLLLPTEGMLISGNSFMSS